MAGGRLQVIMSLIRVCQGEVGRLLYDGVMGVFSKLCLSIREGMSYLLSVA